MATQSSDDLVFMLPHGIQLTVWKNAGNLGIRDVAAFLADAMKHFDQHQTEFGNSRYADGCCATVKRSRKKIGTIVLTHPGEEKLSPALWREAVVEGYTNANSVEQMLDDLPAWRQATEREGGTLSEIVKMLDKPEGDLQAFAAMLERKRML